MSDREQRNHWCGVCAGDTAHFVQDGNRYWNVDRTTGEREYMPKELWERLAGVPAADISERNDDADDDLASLDQ